MINLCNLNSQIGQHHFKMEGIKSVKELTKKGDWLTKLDLKDAYLSVPINHTPAKVSVAEPNISVRLTSLRSFQHPLHIRIHQAPQTGGGNPEKVGDQSGSLFGRHAAHGQLKKRKPKHT